MIKVCINPYCEAVFHSDKDPGTSCTDCDMRVVRIDLKTYWRKFKNNYFQYGTRPKKNQLSLF